MELVNQVEQSTSAAQPALVKGLGAAVLTRRLQLGTSQDDLCRKSGLNRSLIVRLEMGLLDIELTTLYKIAEALQIKPSALIEMAETEAGMAETEAAM